MDHNFQYLTRARSHAIEMDFVQNRAKDSVKLFGWTWPACSNHRVLMWRKPKHLYLCPPQLYFVLLFSSPQYEITGILWGMVFLFFSASPTCPICSRGERVPSTNLRSLLSLQRRPLQLQILLQLLRVLSPAWLLMISSIATPPSQPPHYWRAVCCLLMACPLPVAPQPAMH